MMIRKRGNIFQRTNKAKRKDDSNVNLPIMDIFDGLPLS